MDNPDGKPDAKRRSPPFTVTAREDRAAMQFDEVSHDGQPQAQTAVLPRRSAVGLPEPLEDVRQKIGGDAHARVTDDNLDAGIDALDPHLDAAMLRRELRGVRQKVPHDLP